MEVKYVNPYYFMPKLKTIRSNMLGLKQEELANKIGIRRETISRYENNDIWPQNKDQYEAIVKTVTDEIVAKNDKELLETYLWMIQTY